MRTRFVAMIGFSIFAPILSFAQACDAQRNEFKALETRLIFANEDAWKRFDQKQYETDTEAAHMYLQRQILARLKSGSADPMWLESLVRCIQDIPAYRAFRAETNTPVVFALGGESKAIAVAYSVYRGGSAIPDTLPYLEAYVTDGSPEWKIIGMPATSFERSTFFVHTLASPVIDESWFLLSGFEIGDTGTRLRLQVCSLHNRDMRIIWTRSGLIHTTLAEVHPSYLVLSQYKGFKEGHDVFQKQRLDVVPGGLRDHTEQLN